MKSKRKYIYALLTLMIVTIASVSMVFAAYVTSNSITGSTFKTGSPNLKFLSNLTQGIAPENLKSELPGPTFDNITPNWHADYPIKFVNVGTTNLKIQSNADYQTANDPDDLRSYIYVELIDWHDNNGNGLAEDNELEEHYGRKTIVKWKTEGFDLGTIVNTKEVRGLLLRFSTEALSDAKQGKTGVYNFVFSGSNLN